jgi:hypothetical protein
VKLSYRLRSLSAIEAPPNIRAGILAALDAEGAIAVQPWSANWRALTGWRWMMLAAAAVALLFAGNLARESEDVAAPLVDQALVGLSGSGSLISSDAAILARWLEAQVGHPVDVPQIANASLKGARIATMNGVDAVAVSYLMDGKELTYFAMPSAEIMGEAVTNMQVRTTSAGGFNVATWTEQGAARALVAQMNGRRLEVVAKQCKRSERNTTSDSS